MTDYTREILALQRSRLNMQAAKKLAEVEVKELYAARIRDEIKRRTEQAELDFAHDLANAVESGIPQSLLRSEVLRTNVWSRWTYWRDLANITPERVVVQNAKRERQLAELPYRWNEDYSELAILRVDGVALEFPFYVIEWGVGSGTTDIGHPDSLMWAVGKHGVDYLALHKVAVSAIDEAYAAKQITDRTVYYNTPGIKPQRVSEIDAEITNRNERWLTNE